MSPDPKTTVKLTYREYRCFPSDGRRHEIIDGEHIVNPAPETYHQTVSRRIQFQLYSQIELTGKGEIYDAPTDLQLSEFDIVQPDLILVLKRERNIITPAKIKGTPDLVVEILSPSTCDIDKDLKKELYRKSGVPEYWIVDPVEHRVDQFVLRDGAYELRGQHAARMDVAVVPGVSVDLTTVW